MPKPKHVKQDEAEERHEKYRSLTPESRLTRVESRPGNSKRERSRLLGAIESRGKHAKKKTDDAE